MQPLRGRRAAPSFRENVLEQPENLERAALAAREALASLDLRPLREGVLIFSGIGASWHAMAPTVQALRAAGRRAFAVPATELAAIEGAGVGDAYVIVSQSGASAEAVRAMERLAGSFVVAVTAGRGSVLARDADAWLPLGSYEETAVASLSYTSTLQTLGLLCDALLEVDRGADWAAMPVLARRTLEECDPQAAALAERFREVRVLDAIGGGIATGTAGEAALLVREGLLLPATGLDTRQYLHGPLEAVAEGFGCLLFGAEREISLAASLASYGAAVAVVSERSLPVPAGVSRFGLDPVIDLATPILEILPIQLLVTHLARARGRTVGELHRPQPDTKVA
jgi:glutamine---fructose-6-phosphate transaminase (isomerizing)